MSDTQRQYPVRCAKCSVEKGFPHQVRTVIDKPGHLEVMLRCRDCGHEWCEVVPTRD